MKNNFILFIKNLLETDSGDIAIQPAIIDASVKDTGWEETPKKKKKKTKLLRRTKVIGDENGNF